MNKETGLPKKGEYLTDKEYAERMRRDYGVWLGNARVNGADPNESLETATDRLRSSHANKIGILPDRITISVVTDRIWMSGRVYEENEIRGFNDGVLPGDRFVAVFATTDQI